MDGVRVTSQFEDVLPLALKAKQYHLFGVNRPAFWSGRCETHRFVTCVLNS